MTNAPLADWELIQVRIFLYLTETSPGAKEEALALGLDLDFETYRREPERWRDLRARFNAVAAAREQRQAETR